MKRFNFLFLSLALVSQINAKADHVYPVKVKTGDTYVRVTKINDDLIKLERCIYDQSTQGTDAEDCSTIGPRESYSIKALEKQKNSEIAQVFASGGGIIGGVIVGAGVGLAGGLAGVSLFAAEAGYNGWLLIIGTTATGGTVGGVVSAKLDAVNPQTQFRQAEALIKVTDEQNSEVNNAEVFIHHLTTVLEKLEE